MGADVGMHLIGRLAPPGGTLEVTAHIGQLGASVGRDPTQQFGRSEVLRGTAHLPYALIRFPPMGPCRLHLPREHRPAALVYAVTPLRVQVHRIQQHPPDVVLTLTPSPVTDTHRP